MKKLSDNWFFEGTIDFEYKKYILLAYLQDVDKYFTINKLYPHLGELVKQYRNLQRFLDSKEELRKKFPSKLEGFDTQNFRMIYKKVLEDDELMEELQAIVDFSVLRIGSYLRDGKEIYELIEKNIVLNPVGVIPLDNTQGIFFIRNGKEKLARVYRYKAGIFMAAGEKYRTIMASFLRSYTISYYAPYLKIKEKIMGHLSYQETPATYAFESELQIPVKETYLPIAKRMLARYLVGNND